MTDKIASLYSLDYSGWVAQLLLRLNKAYSTQHYTLTRLSSIAQAYSNISLWQAVGSKDQLQESQLQETSMGVKYENLKSNYRGTIMSVAM